jgi:hypothetical protein
MLKLQKLNGYLGRTFLLLLVTICIVGCSAIEKTEILLKPIDNGIGVPGVVVLHGYDEDKDRYEGLLLGKKQEFVYINGEDVDGGVLLPRNRALELLAKEGGLSLLLEKHPELIDETLAIVLSEETRLRALAK